MQKNLTKELKRYQHQKHPIEDEEMIMRLFLSINNNTTTNISELTGFKVFYVSNVITKYLANKERIAEFKRKFKIN